jgi:hypothetical protein
MLTHSSHQGRDGNMHGFKSHLRGVRSDGQYAWGIVCSKQNPRVATLLVSFLYFY